MKVIIVHQISKRG